MNQVTQLIKVPKLAIGDDKTVAEMLVKKHDQANEATKVIFDTGLLCYFIKANLKHGEFGSWLQAHCPEKMWRKNKKGNVVASSTLSWQMNLTRGLVEKCKTTVGKLLSQIPKSWEFANRGEFLQLSEESKLLLQAPEQVVAVHHKVSEIAEGKSAYQLFLEFKQTDDDDDDETGPKPKRGRRKGEGGASKEQRAAAALREEAERITALKLDSTDFAKWLDKNADLKSLGAIVDSKEVARLLESMESAVSFLNRIKRGGAR